MWNVLKTNRAVRVRCSSSKPVRTQERTLNLTGVTLSGADRDEVKVCKTDSFRVFSHNLTTNFPSGLFGSKRYYADRWEYRTCHPEVSSLVRTQSMNMYNTIMQHSDFFMVFCSHRLCTCSIFPFASHVG